MTRCATFFALLGFVLAVSSLSAASEDHVYKPTGAEHTAMLRNLDQVFGWAGVRRRGDLRRLVCGESKTEARCTAKLFLEVDGHRRPYNIELRGKPRALRFAAFYPDEPTPSDIKSMSQGYSLDRNDVKDPRSRAFAIAAVTKFNRHLGWHWLSGPMIQREGRNLLVTYHTVSDEKRKDAVALLMSGEPSHVTFYVSPRGTICGALYSE
jgi:hypothetical protein